MSFKETHQPKLRFLSARSIILSLAILISSSAFAEEILSVNDAYMMARHDEIMLLDIRSEGEWKETGVANVAKPLSMHDDQFLTKFLAMTKQGQGKPIALICATGGRSAWLKKELASRGITNLLDVTEGMMGSPAGPGWLKSKLPVTSYSENVGPAISMNYTFWERITGAYHPLWMDVK